MNKYIYKYNLTKMIKLVYIIYGENIKMKLNQGLFKDC